MERPAWSASAWSDTEGVTIPISTPRRAAPRRLQTTRSSGMKYPWVPWIDFRAHRMARRRTIRT